MSIEAETCVAGGEGRNEDVDLAIIEKIVLQWSRHHFHFVLGADTHGIDVHQRVRDDVVGLGWWWT